MNGPPRLKEEGGFAADLLRSADVDGPPAGARALAAAALSLSISGVAATSAAAAVPTAQAAAAPVAVAPTITAKLGASLVTKLVFGVVAAVGVGVGARQIIEVELAHTSQHARAPERVAVALPAPPPSRPDAEGSPPIVVPVTRPRTATASRPIAPSPTIARRPEAVSPTAYAPAAVVATPIVPPLVVSAPAAPDEAVIAPPVASTLSREITLIDRALAALRHHDPRAARAALDEYERSFPAGTMAPEADVARIELLLATGERSAARALADAFLSAHATSPLAPRVRDLMRP